MSQNRVCDTQTLQFLARQARSHKLNRQVNLDWAARELDEDGTHLLKLVLWGHNGSHSTELHHRVFVFAKVLGSHEPAFVTLDVLDIDWVRLTTADEYMASVSAADTEASTAT